jgi:hypothetical protein
LREDDTRRVGQFSLVYFSHISHNAMPTWGVGVTVVFRGQISGWVGPLDLHTLLYIAQLRLTYSLVH